MGAKKYVQFSKRIVVAVTVAVTVICAAALVLCYLGGDMEQMVGVTNAYIGYATVAFVAYSGNSAAEKWLTRKYANVHTSDTETTIQNG